MAENLLQKCGRRNRKDSHSIYRRAKNYARFQPLYGRSTAILMDTAPFRVNDAAVVLYAFLSTISMCCIASKSSHLEHLYVLISYREWLMFFWPNNKY